MAVFNEPTKWAQTLGKDADVVAIPNTAGDTDPSIDKIFPSVFSIPLAHGGKAIPRSVLNGLFKLLGDWSFYQQNGGIASYSAIFDYAIGRVVLYNGNLYKCIHANGASSTVVTPDSNTAYWQRLDNFVRSVNSVNADGNGNVSITSVNHATTADSATKATNDSNGNNISNTYYPLKGGALRGQVISRNVTDDGLYVCGGTGWTNGGSIYIRGKDNENGKITIDAHNGTKYSRFEVGVDFCSFNDKNIVRSVNNVNADGNGNVQLGNIGAITGEIKWFAFNTAPYGYLVCNGANVSRTTYADLFNAIGTTFGSGDGLTTYTLPNLINKFAQGSATVGTVKSAGLPNITGGLRALYYKGDTDNGAFYIGTIGNIYIRGGASDVSYLQDQSYGFDASRSSLIYGNSTTVQPPALTLLPCIKY